MGKKTRTEYAILNIVTGLGGYFINTILGLMCRIIFTRTLSAEYLGISGLFTNILTMLSLAELGIGSAIVYALYRPLALNDEEKVASLVQFYGKCYRAIGIITGVLGIALVPFLNGLINEQPNINESLYLIYGIYLFNTASSYFFSYRSSLIMAAQQNYIVTGINYLVTILQSVLQMLWLLLTQNYIGYLIIQTMGTLIYNIVISHIAKKKFPYIVKKDIKPLECKEKKGLISNIKALVIWKLAGLLVNSTDNIIITYFNGLAMVGLSSNYTLLSGTLNSLLNQVFNGITASVGNLNAIETKEKKKSMFYIINLLNFWLFGWSAIGIFVVSNDIVKLLFGTQYVLSLNIPFIIAINFYMVGMQNAVWTFKNTLGLFRPGRYLLILTAVINLGCSVWWGNIWGLFGILLATAVSRLCTNIWYDPYAVFKYGFEESVFPYVKKYVFFLGVLFLAGILSYCACELIKFNVIINVILKFMICCVIPNVIFFVCLCRLSEFNYLKNLFVTIGRKGINKMHAIIK